jgi:hypothetical protein
LRLACGVLASIKNDEIGGDKARNDNVPSHTVAQTLMCHMY